jgi:protein ImuA
MKPSARHRLIDDLRQRIRALDGSVLRERAVLPFAIAAIDRHLPGGGLPLGSLHEVVGGHQDLSHGAAAALFIGGVLARLEKPVLWVMKRRDLFAPGLAGVGLHPDCVIYAEAGDTATLFMAMEEGLGQTGLAAVVGEADRLPFAASRRLQLAAEKSGVMAVALRRWRMAEGEGETAALTRWRVSALPSASLPVAGLGRPRWHLELLRCRNGEAASWIVEGTDAQGHIALPSEPGRRQAATKGARRAA